MAAGLIAAGLCACSGAPLPTEFELAHAKEAARDDEGALTLYRMVRSDCERPGATPRPHDDCGLAVVREAQLLERLGRFREALASWLEVPKRSREPRTKARALARAAALCAEELHDEPAAERLAWRTVREYPDELPADDALHLAVRLGARRDPRELARALDEAYPHVAKLDLGDNVLFERAELLRTTLDDPAGAVRTYDLLAARYPRSSLRDDALWSAAQLLRARGDLRGALARLRVIRESRRDALVTGSYNSVYLDDAELATGQLYLELHDLEHAIEAFSSLATDFPESTLQDDALLELARAQLLRHAPPAAADVQAACAALARLLADFPDGNRVRPARELSAELECPAP